MWLAGNIVEKHAVCRSQIRTFKVTVCNKLLITLCFISLIVIIIYLNFGQWASLEAEI